MAVAGGQATKKVMQNSAVAEGNGTAMKPVENVTGFSVLAIQITGINGDTITFEGTIDGTNWVSVVFKNIATNAEAATATANGIYRADVSALSQVRARVSTYGSGTIVCTGQMVA